MMDSSNLLRPGNSCFKKNNLNVYYPYGWRSQPSRSFEMGNYVEYCRVIKNKVSYQVRKNSAKGDEK